MRNDEIIVLEVVREDGRALEFVSEKLKNESPDGALLMGTTAPAGLSVASSDESESDIV